MPITTEVRVRYAETDQMGIVYYANYLVWFEIGRVELMRSLGLAYSQLETEHQCILPVIEASCRYRSPARYDDEILIETRPSLLRGSVIKFAYRILRKAPEGKEPTAVGLCGGAADGDGGGVARLQASHPHSIIWQTHLNSLLYGKRKHRVNY
jgi:acyl-CoA thioester hydrolase